MHKYSSLNKYMESLAFMASMMNPSYSRIQVFSLGENRINKANHSNSILIVSDGLLILGSTSSKCRCLH